MNFNIDLWDKTDAKEFGERKTLKLGGHELIILDAEEYKSESGNISLKITIDIADKDEQKGFFKKQYEENTNTDKKWPTAGVKYLSLKDEQLPYLKGFITALENSNTGFKFNKNGTWDQLKQQHIAGVFGLEEYTKQDGSVGAATKLVQFRSLDKLQDIKIPKVKLINGNFIAYEEYQKNRTSSNSNVNNTDPFNDFGDVVEISDDFLD